MEREKKLIIDGIQIPIEVALNKDLSGSDQMLFGIINSLISFDGVCDESNNYFALLLGKSSQTVSNSISKLKKI